MANKMYVLEVGCESVYCGFAVQSRTLYSTYQKAYDAYEKILHEHYTEEELEEVSEEAENNSCGDANLLEDWVDANKDIYLNIYEVEVAD